MDAFGPWLRPLVEVVTPAVESKNWDDHGGGMMLLDWSGQLLLEPKPSLRAHRSVCALDPETLASSRNGIGVLFLTWTEARQRQRPRKKVESE